MRTASKSLKKSLEMPGLAPKAGKYEAVVASDDSDLLAEADVGHASAKQLAAKNQKKQMVDRLFDSKVTFLGECINDEVD